MKFFWQRDFALVDQAKESAWLKRRDKHGPQQALREAEALWQERPKSRRRREEIELRREDLKNHTRVARILSGRGRR